MAPVSGCLVLMCGYPCSGKSAAAADLARKIRSEGGPVTIIDEPGLHLHRNASYADAHAEKNTRGLLKSTVDRALYKDGPVVILDSGNHIKGYRYELWCIARQAGARFCVVHCDTPAEDARRWNAARRRRGDTGDETREEGGGDDAPSSSSSSSEWGGYEDPIFDDLLVRFERPDSKNRWDSPLFTLRPPIVMPAGGSGEKEIKEEEREGDGGVSGSLEEGRVNCYNDTSREETLDIAVAMMTGKSEREGGSAGSRALTPNAATQPSTLLSDTNLRTEIDAGAQEVIEAVLRATADGCGGGGGGVVSFGEGLPQLRCRRPLSLQVLRRLKRTFLKLIANSLARTRTTRQQIKTLFIEYVQQNAEQD